MMPQSLLVNTPPQQTGNAVKRQRSADGRNPQQQPISAGQNGSQTSTLRSNRPQLKPNVKIPPYLEKSKTEIASTFQELEWKQRFRLFHAMKHPDTSPYRVDRSDVVIERNRYGGVQPWDASRVKLKKPIGGSDYVNASPIILKSKTTTKSSSSAPEALSTKSTRYIATQGPKLGQASHFWHMVHQETVGDTAVVVMLTQLVESNKEKCAPYYPAELSDPVMILQREEVSTNVDVSVGNGSDPFLDDDQISSADDIKGAKAVDSQSESKTTMPEPDPTDKITLISKTYDSSVECEVRRLTLTIDGESKNVMHYLFDRWPDFGKPDTNDQKALFELSRRTLVEAGDSPRIVHCSAGVGRTGTWIALDFLVREVEEDRLLDSVKPATSNRTTNEAAVKANSSVPSEPETWGKSGPPKVNTPTREEGFEKDEYDLIYETVNTLREQRMMMVIREVQLSFLYDVVREALFEKYRAKPEGATIVTDGAALIDDPETLPRQAKVLKTQGAVGDDHDDGVSEAETEIIEAGVEQTVVDGPGGGDDDVDDDNDDDDPYKAASPDVLRRTLSHNV